jgi:hypothetical protein
MFWFEFWEDMANLFLEPFIDAYWAAEYERAKRIHGEP